jgi:glyoxylate reductase
MTRDELVARVPGIDALFCNTTDTIIDAEVMDAAGPQLRVIATFSVGYDHIELAAATARGITVTNTPEVLTETTADLAWGLLMAVARRVAEADRYIRAGRWVGWWPELLLGVDVHGKTLGIFGMGRIGRAVARRAAGFNMRVIYFDPAAPALPDALNAEAVDKSTLLAESDFISIHCPLTPETTHAFGGAEFAAMKDSACLINAARGPIVDEAALADALKAGQIRAAGLDVFEDEPKVHPGLLDRDNVVMTAHMGSASVETRALMSKMAASNIIARLHGDRPPNCVNPEVLGE